MPTHSFRTFLAVSLCLTLLAPSLAPLAAATGTIRGTLIDSNGQPLVGYVIKVRDASGAVFESQPTGSDGAFEITGVPPGKYTYEMVDPEGRLISVRIPEITLEEGTILTQPIAIVPIGQDKDKLVAWLVGGGVGLLLIILGTRDDDGELELVPISMTPSGVPPGP